MNSLGFNKKEKDTKVIVAMSGGVDSSVAAVYPSQRPRRPRARRPPPPVAASAPRSVRGTPR